LRCRKPGLARASIGATGVDQERLSHFSRGAIGAYGDWSGSHEIACEARRNWTRVIGYSKRQVDTTIFSNLGGHCRKSKAVN
jgi:hypothetical protein